MAKVSLTINEMSTENDYDKKLFESFCNRYSEEFGSFANYLNENEWYLMDEEITSGDEDDKSKFLSRFISKWSSTKNEEHHQESPSISTGDEGFSDEFYSDLFEIAGQITLSFDATVIGYGDGYYNCSYELNPDGWCGYCDYYENED